LLRNLTTLVACLLLTISLGCTNGEQPHKEATKPDGKAPTEKSPAAPAEKQTPREPEESLSGEVILERMVSAYQKARSYADHGQLQLHAVVSGENRNLNAPFMLAMERPNKLRLEAYEAKIVCNDEGFFALVENIPNQVLSRPPLDKITFGSLFTDPILAEAWTRGFGGPMPQVLLLFGKNPLQDLLAGTDKVHVLDPGEIDGRACHRLRLDRTEGAATFWIDRETYALRRLVMPSDPIRRALSQEGRVDSISLSAEFTNAELDGAIDPNAFKLETPEKSEMVKHFLPAPLRMLGKQEPNLEFVDLEGKPVKIGSLAGKVVVLDFWATWCGPCRESLPKMHLIAEQFKDNPNVVFYAVSVDDEETGNEQLTKTFKELEVNLPILRDPKKSAAGLQFNAIPTLFVIGPNGVIQDCVIGGEPTIAEVLPGKINALLDGKNIHEQGRREYEEKLEEYSRMIATELAAAETDLPDLPKVEERPLPEVNIAPRSEPQRLKLTQLWKCDKVTTPGNILVVRDGDGPARLLTVDKWNTAAEIGLDGNLIAVHKLDLAEAEAVYTLRSVAAADGKRYYLATLLSQQRCHVYDENWQPIAHYPAGALENRHSGIADAEIADLDGDGQPNVYVGYWGLAGVQGASLDGRRLWSNRSLSEVACIAVGAPDAEGKRDLFCTSGGGEIVALDAKGERKGEILVLGRSFQWIAAADLRGDGRWLWCGMAEPRTGGNVAIGFAPDGTELWSYDMPSGIPQYPIEPIIPGRINREGPGLWLLPGPDGSIHFVSADGVLIDRFNSGGKLHGLATVEIDGRPALVVADDGGLEAWAIAME